MYSFPNNISGCHNDTDCLDATCTLTYDKGAHYWCDCKTYYNPLDGCRTNYFETLDPAISWSYLALSVVLNIACIGFLASRVFYEVDRWWYYRNTTTVPRSKFVTISINVFCCIVDIIAAGFYKAGLGKASFMINGLSSDLFMVCLFSTIYYLFVILKKSNKLGNLRGRWRTLSLSIIIIGPVGLLIASIFAIIRDSTYYNATVINILTVIVSIDISITIISVLSISIPLIIVMIVRFSRSNKQKSSTIQVLQRCSRIVIGMAVYIILALIILLMLSYFFPIQLFDVITLYRFIAELIYAGGRFLYASFFLSMKLQGRLSKVHNKDKVVKSTVETHNTPSKTTATTLSVGQSRDTPIAPDSITSSSISPISSITSVVTSAHDSSISSTNSAISTELEVVA